MIDISDEAVAMQVQTGDTDAFGVLIERFEKKLKRYARKFLNYQEDIDDLVQDVFIKAYTNINSFDVTQSFSPWIYRIAHNTFVNQLRKKQHLSFSFFDMDTLFPQLAAIETADSHAIATELKKQLEESLETLDVKYRAPMVLYFYEDLSYKEISEVLRIPVTTVGVRINRGKEMLRTEYNFNTKSV